MEKLNVIEFGKYGLYFYKTHIIVIGSGYEELAVAENDSLVEP